MEQKQEGADGRVEALVVREASMKDETMPDAMLKALSALNAMSELWATEVNLRGMVNNISSMPRLKMLDAIEALVKQAFVEGAYRHHCDAKDGKVPGMTYNASGEPTLSRTENHDE